MSDETTLLPCPFCGGEARPVKQIEGRYAIARYSVSCNGCGFVAFYEATEAEAIAAWNTRHVETCRITASSTDGLCSDNPRQYFKLSCGHSFTINGLEAPVACAVCGKVVKNAD